jgi:adenylyl-sulfate kinase
MYTIWFTGRPCCGKTTIAKAILPKLKEKFKVVHLDGDVVRKGLCSDLGFSKEDRKENLRRIAHLCEIFNENNTIVLATFVSPTNADRELIKSIIKNCKMIYVNASLEECEKRDVKGMYAKARKGEIKSFTGLHEDAPFERPIEFELELNTEKESLEESVGKVLGLFE